MKLFLVSQDHNAGYDTYDSAVVVATDEEEARKTPVGSVGSYGSWAPDRYVTVRYLGEADPSFTTPQEVICASFNAG